MGGPKARYFESRGYSVRAPEVLERTLREVAEKGQVTDKQDTPWGVKYLVIGQVLAPDGNPMSLATVWIVSEDRPPVLVTAYPERKRS